MADDVVGWRWLTVIGGGWRWLALVGGDWWCG